MVLTEQYLRSIVYSGATTSKVTIIIVIDMITF